VGNHEFPDFGPQELLRLGVNLSSLDIDEGGNLAVSEQLFFTPYPMKTLEHKHPVHKSNLDEDLLYYLDLEDFEPTKIKMKLHLHGG
jgi:hypothetical protein